MATSKLPPQDYIDIAEKVRTGEYFREAHNIYDFNIHDPMSERYFYLFVSGIAMLILLVAFYAMQMLYPLQLSVPFIYNANNIVEDIPRMKTLQAYKGENASEALLRFRVQNFVVLREEYDIDLFDRSVSGVKSQTSPELFSEYQQYIDPHNPESPITLYQRHSRRKITIISTRRLKEQEFGMEVIYEAAVESKGDAKTSRWKAEIAFNYSGIALDEKTGKVKPIAFVVTQYRTKRLQDVK